VGESGRGVLGVDDGEFELEELLSLGSAEGEGTSVSVVFEGVGWVGGVGGFEGECGWDVKNEEGEEEEREGEGEKGRGVWDGCRSGRVAFQFLGHVVVDCELLLL